MYYSKFDIGGRYVSGAKGRVKSICMEWRRTGQYRHPRRTVKVVFFCGVIVLCAWSVGGGAWLLALRLADCNIVGHTPWVEPYYIYAATEMYNSCNQNSNCF